MIQPLSLSWRRHAVLTCAQAARLDALTIAAGTAGFVLMTRAGDAVARVVMEKYAPRRTVVFCGPGNNGGDGFVIAEKLRMAGWDVVVVTTISPESMRGDAGLAAAAYQGKIAPFVPALLTDDVLVIDALFGTGLDRALSPDVAAVIERVNTASAPVVSVDLPSGLHGDTGAVMGAAVQADITVTFTAFKPGLLLWPGRGLAGDVIIADIGMDPTAWDGLRPITAVNQPDLWRDQLPVFHLGQHKYDHGHAVIYGGGVMTGAARLAARAAQRVGTGLVTVAAPAEAIGIYASNLDSVLVQRRDDLGAWVASLEDQGKTAILVGPGAGREDWLRQAVLAALATGKPCVLDADALTIFADAPDQLFAALHARCVLTPHGGEFSRLFGRLPGGKLAAARAAAVQAGAIVLLKGSDTVIAAPDGVALVNINAPAWLATGGSGDVLAGVITGLMAQGVGAMMAAAMAAWVHGRAAQDFRPGMIAEDLVAALPVVMAGLRDETVGVK